MRVLADTSVWSLALRRRANVTLSAPEQQLMLALSEAIRNGLAVIIGPIRQELLSGIKEQAQFEKLRSKLQAFPDEPLATADYEHAASLHNRCRAKGLTCGVVDMLICAVAERRGWKVLSSDDGLNTCLRVVQSIAASSQSAERASGGTGPTAPQVRRSKRGKRQG
jgi:predicted nucleic acid-binding protein